MQRRHTYPYSDSSAAPSSGRSPPGSRSENPALNRRGSLFRDSVDDDSGARRGIIATSAPGKRRRTPGRPPAPPDSRRGTTVTLPTGERGVRLDDSRKSVQRARRRCGASEHCPRFRADDGATGRTGSGRSAMPESEADASVRFVRHLSRSIPAGARVPTTNGVRETRAVRQGIGRSYRDGASKRPEDGFGARPENVHVTRRARGLGVGATPPREQTRPSSVPASERPDTLHDQRRASSIGWSRPVDGRTRRRARGGRRTSLDADAATRRWFSAPLSSLAGRDSQRPSPFAVELVNHIPLYRIRRHPRP